MTAPADPPVSSGLVDAIGDKLAQVHRENVAVTHASLADLVTEILEGHEQDLAQFVRPLLAHLTDHPDLAPEVKDALNVVTAPEHQTQFFTALFAVRAIIDQFVFAAIAPLVQDVSNLVWPHHTSMPFPPAEAALAVLRHNVGADWAAGEAAKSGMSPEDFAIMVLNTGEPPGLAQLQEALRRGIVDEGRFAKGVQESRVRDEWLSTLIALRYVPPPVGEVLAAAVQGHLDLGEASHRISEAGIDPANFDWLYQTHGRPPGTVELLHLMNRGEIGASEVEQAIRESDIKNKYIPALMKLARVIPPMRTVVAMVRQSVITPPQGIAKLQDLGYNAEDAAALVSEATTQRRQHTRDLTESQIVSAYTERLLPRDQATQHLAALGLDANETEMVLALADHQRHYRFVAAGINRVHAVYVAHRLTAGQASTALDGMGVDPAGRDDYLKLWKAERDANVRTLTITDLHGLVRRSLMDKPTFVTRAVQLGYSHDDAVLQYALAFPPAKVTAPAKP